MTIFQSNKPIAISLYGSATERRINIASKTTFAAANKKWKNKKKIKSLFSLFIALRITIFTLCWAAKFKGRNNNNHFLQRFVTFFLSRNVWKSCTAFQWNWIDNNVNKKQNVVPNISASGSIKMRQTNGNLKKAHTHAQRKENEIDKKQTALPYWQTDTKQRKNYDEKFVFILFCDCAEMYTTDPKNGNQCTIALTMSTWNVRSDRQTMLRLFWTEKKQTSIRLNTFK